MDSLASFRQNTTNTDPDIRYMAVSDLIKSITKNEGRFPAFMTSNGEQRSVLDTLLALVQNEMTGLVQEQVQKCFGVICASGSLFADVCQHALTQLLVLAENLRSKTGNAAEGAREAVFLALKAAVTSTQRAPQLKNVCLPIAPKLISFIQDSAAPADFRVRASECLAVVLQITPEFAATHYDASTTLFALLVGSTLPSLSLFRKRLVSCLVSFSTGLSDTQFAAFAQALCTNLDNAAEASTSSTTFETLSALVQIISPVASASNGARLSFYMKSLLPVLTKICGEPSSARMDDQGEEDFDEGEDNDKAALDELRSLVFQACEVLIAKSTLATFRPLADQVIKFATKFAAYDPDYFGDDQDDSDGDDDESTGGEMKDSESNGDEMAGDGSECFSDEDFSGSDFGDDFASTSWKVRRDVLRCLVAVSATATCSVEFFGSVLTLVFPLVTKRIQDHDENVRAEALSAAAAIFRSTGSVINAVYEKKVFALTTHLESLVTISLTHSALIARKVAKLLRNDQSIRIRSGCVQVAATLVRLDDTLARCKMSCEQNKDQHQNLVTALSGILTVVNTALASGESGAAQSSAAGSTDMTTASFRIDSLAFIRACFSMTLVSIVSFEQAISVASTIARCVTDSYLRSAAEALRVIPPLVTVISRLCSTNPKESAVPCVEALARAVIQELGVQTIDQEVKDAATHALASILSETSDLVSPSTRNDGCLPVLLTVLRTPTSRSSGIKAILTLTAPTNKPLDLSSVSGQFLAELCDSIKLNNRQQRQTALAAAAALMEHESSCGTLAAHQAEAVFANAWSYLSETDLYMSHLVLRVATCAVANGGSNVKSIFTNQFMPLVNTLLCSQMLQGTALSSLIACFRACGAAAVFSSHPAVVEHFATLASAKDTPKQALLPIASVCAAYVNGIPDPASRQGVIQVLFNLTRLPLAPENQARLTFGMLALGNVGRENDLSSLGNAIVDQVALPAITNGWDDLRSAAAYMLGSVAAGCVPPFIQAIFAWSKKASESEQYYVLSALRELSSCLLEANKAAAIEPFSAELLQVLKALIASGDEGKRSVAAECLGKLCLLVPQALCSAILEMYTDSSKENRTVAAIATRFALCSGTTASSISDRIRFISEFFYGHSDAIVALVSDPEVQVRRAALVTLNSVIRHNSLLIPGETLRKNVAPLVLRETEIRNELVEKIRVGTNVIVQDHGLEARKVAFDCLSAILLACPDALDLGSILSHLGAGLRDDNDIVIMAINACARLISSFDSQVFLPVFDKEVTPALEQLLFPPKSNKNVDPNSDSHFELKRAALRLVALIKAIPSVTTSAPAFSKMVSVSISSNKSLAETLKEIETA